MADVGVVKTSERLGYYLLLVALFAFGLFDHSLWSANDTREGAMIAEMYRTNIWVTPILNGDHYLEKPPLLHWTSLLFCHAFGMVNEGLVRLPAALYGFGTAILLILLGRRTGRERAGFAAAFMCGTALLFLEYSKIVLTDVALAFMVLFSLYLFWVAYTAVRYQKLLYGLFIVSSAAAFYAKGLLGPGFIWVSVGMFLLFQKKWKLAFILGLIFVPVFLALLAPWIWALWQTGGQPFVKGVFWDNQFGRFLTFHDETLPVDPFRVHKEPFYYYLKSMPVALLPWTFLVIPALVNWFRPGRGLNSPFQMFLRASLVSMLLILHVSAAKAGCYAIPLFPVICLMTAIWLDDAAGKTTSLLDLWAMKLTVGLTIIISALIPLAYAFLLIAPQSFHDRYFQGVDVLRVIPPGMTLLCGLMALLAFAGVVYSILYIRKETATGVTGATCLQLLGLFTVILILNCETIVPAYDYQRTYRPFAELVRDRIRHGRKVALAATDERHVGAFTFYLRQNLQIVKSNDFQDVFLSLNGPACDVIVETRYLPVYESMLQGIPHRALRPEQHKGYKSDEFRLIVNDMAPLRLSPPGNIRIGKDRK